MPDTLQNIQLVASTWIDLYAESGIAPGTQIVITNLSSKFVKFYAGASVPVGAENDDNTGSYDRLIGYEEKVNQIGDVGAWAFTYSSGLLNVKVF